MNTAAVEIGVSSAESKEVLWYHKLKSMVWCEGYFVQSLLGNHQPNCPSTNGVSTLVSLIEGKLC